MAGTESRYICTKKTSYESMKCMRCLNHNLQHITSEKSECPTPATVTPVQPSIYQATVHPHDH
jgi:hypothetical protein